MWARTTPTCPSPNTLPARFTPSGDRKVTGVEAAMSAFRSSCREGTHPTAAARATPRATARRDAARLVPDTGTAGLPLLAALLPALPAGLLQQLLVLLLPHLLATLLDQ